MNALLPVKECSGVAEKWDFLIFLRVGLTVIHKETCVYVSFVCVIIFKKIFETLIQNQFKR